MTGEEFKVEMHMALVLGNINCEAHICTRLT
jgi:hypothetical protein